MSKFTDFLNLFKWDPVEDAEEEFNIEKSLNENWDKLDTKLKEYILKLQTNKVDKIEGKSLSTADYTNEEKDKLATIENNSQENIIEKIQKNGVDLKIINKVVNLILSKNDIGLNNVDNTSDLDKPLSNAAKEAIKNRKPTIELLTVSSAAPTQCNIGDKYYNTTTSKIYTAIATNTWGTEGENPSNLYLYADLEHKELYYYDGADFKSYGSGKKEVGYADETLEGTEVILIEESDFEGGSNAILPSQILNQIYPIGSVYISVNNVNPSSLFGGTWEQFAAGRTLVGIDTSDDDFKTVEKTGGEKKHTLTVNEMPSHNHNDGVTTNFFGQTGGQTSCIVLQDKSQGTTSATGGGQPHNNLQPYITCYMWKRIA